MDKKSFLAGVGSTLLVLSVAGGALASYQQQATLDYTGLQVRLNSVPVSFSDVNGNPVEPFAIDGVTYLPVRSLANALGLQVDWDPTTQVIQLTSLASPVLAGTYSFASPAPLGVTQEVEVTDGNESYRASVTVLESVRGDAAWELVEAANRFNTSPPPDQEYIVAKIKVSILSASSRKAISLDSFAFRVCPAEGLQYETVYVSAPPPAFQGRIYPGGTLEGYAVFQVNRSDPSPRLVFGQGTDGQGGIWFQI